MKNLAIFAAETPAAPAPLSPARKQLAQARHDRAVTTAAGEAAARAQTRAASLISAPNPIRTRIAALEAERVRVVSDWSTSGASEKPTLPHEAELAELRAELAGAEKLAAAAQAAMPGIVEQLQRCSREQGAIVKDMLAASALVFEEDCAILIADLVEHDRAAAAIRGRLSAAVGELRLMALRQSPLTEAEFASARLFKSIPARLTATESAIDSNRPAIRRFLEALLADETAELKFDEVNK